MKKSMLVVLITAIITITWSCSRNGRFVNLVNGESITLEKDPVTGAMIDKETKKPVYIYVDTKTHDTIYGRTGEVINGHVLTSEDGRYWYDSDPERNVSVQRNSINGEYKMKVEKDGDIKIKTDSKKIKIDGKTG